MPDGPDVASNNADVEILERSRDEIRPVWKIVPSRADDWHPRLGMTWRFWFGRDSCLERKKK